MASRLWRDLVVALSLIAAATRADGVQILVGTNIQVSLAQTSFQHYETQVAADPRQAGHLIACAYVKSSETTTQNVFYVSFDRGKTWAHTLTVPDSVDPSCAIGSKGVAFAASIHDSKQADGKSASFLDVRRSTDGGRHWEQSAVQVDTRNVDRDYLTVDETHGRIFVHGYLQSSPAKFVFYPSSDAGRTFSRKIEREAGNFDKPWYFPANGVVSVSGAYLALFAELDNTKRNMSYRTDAASAPQGVNGVLKVVRSTDGGASLAPAVKIADVFYDWRVPQLSMASLAVDRSTGRYRGRIYAAWPDAGREGRTQIFLAHSGDDGQTWSPPRIVNDDSGSHANNFMPAVAVSNSGVVGICWYDRRDNADNLGYWPRFSASMNGGESWLPSVRVSTSANVVNEAEHDTRYNGGDTAGLAVDAGGVFHPVWIDNRSGIHQMWTAAVRVGK